jgi:uncharacterized membrane protein YdbT with pleckstrin-like domain
VDSELGGRGALVSDGVDPEPGEQVFFHGHPSWRSTTPFYFKGLIAGLAAGVAAGLVTRLAAGHVEVGAVIAAVLVVFLLLVALAQLRRIQTTYSISNQRLTIETGLFSREVHQTRLERIQNVNSSQSVFERILRIGTVNFDTAAEAEFDFSFRGVGDPPQIVRTVDRALHELRGDSDPPAASDV